MAGTSENESAATAMAEIPATESFWVLFRRRRRPEMLDRDMQTYLFESRESSRRTKTGSGVLASPSGTSAILSASKIWWQRCDVRTPVVDRGPARTCRAALMTTDVALMCPLAGFVSDVGPMPGLTSAG
ncbi:hypothetical protein GCM10010433_57790 [Streptomyces pulveraceus]